jgi:hypothetical protein
MIYGRLLFEKFTNLVELRIYDSQNNDISWLSLPPYPEIMDDNGCPMLIDWTEVEPPLTPEEELKELLVVWHNLCPKLQVVQIAAGSAWRYDDNGRWIEEQC